MDVWMYRFVNGWLYGWMDGLGDEYIGEWVYGLVYRWINGLMDG